MDLLRVFFENPTFVFAWQNIPTIVLVLVLTHGALVANFSWALLTGSKRRATWGLHSDKKGSRCCVKFLGEGGYPTTECVEREFHHGIFLGMTMMFGVLFLFGPTKAPSGWHVWFQGMMFFGIANAVVGLLAKVYGLGRSFLDSTGQTVGGIWKTSLVGRFVRGGYRLWQNRRIMRKALDGVDRASRMLMTDQKDTSAFDGATGKLTHTLKQLLEERRMLLSQLERGGTDPVTRSAQEADAIFSQVSFQKHAGVMIENFRAEHSDLVEVLARIEEVIETITFVCDSLWIPATGARANGRLECLDELREELSGLTDFLDESRSSEVLQDISTGGLQRRLEETLRQANGASTSQTKLKQVRNRA